MAKMILVSGLSGSGKTTLAKFLANKYKYTYNKLIVSEISNGFYITQQQTY